MIDRAVQVYSTGGGDFFQAREKKNPGKLKPENSQADCMQDFKSKISPKESYDYYRFRNLIRST